MPLATILTRSSSGRGSVSSTRSMLKSPKRSRATAAVICMLRQSARLLRERILQVTVLVFRRVDDHLLVPGQELIEATSLNILKLHDNGARLRPFPQLVESDRSDNRTEFVVMDVVRKL